MEESRYFILFAPRAMLEAARVLSEVSSLTTAGQPLAFSTRLVTVRVSSRNAIDSFYLYHDRSGNEYVEK